VALAMLGNLGILGEVAVNDVDRPKYGNALYGAYGQDFATADGRRIMVVALTDRQWRGLLSTTGMAEAIDDLGRRLGLNLALEGDRFTARREITAMLGPWFAERTVDDFAPSFDKSGVTWSIFRSFKQAAEQDPDLSEAHPMFSLLDQPGIGPYLVPGTPFASSVSERTPARPASTLGQHSEEILADVLGLGGAEIGRLFDAGVVAGPRR